MDKVQAAKIQAAKIQALRDCAARFEYLAQQATAADVQDRYLKAANRCRQRAEAEQQNALRKDSS